MLPYTAHKERKLARPFRLPVFWHWTLRENLSIIFKSSGLIAWFIIFILALLELKQYYNIDVLPGYNSSLDDTYGAVKGTISEFFR